MAELLEVKGEDALELGYRLKPVMEVRGGSSSESEVMEVRGGLSSRVRGHGGSLSRSKGRVKLRGQGRA